MTLVPGQESSFKDRRDFARMPSDFERRALIFSLPVYFLKKRALSFTLTLGVLAKSLLSLKLLSCPGTSVNGASVFENYSPLLALAALGFERFCEKDSAILKKRALTFTLTLGILGKSLLSLKLLSCPGICGTGTKIDWPGKNERSPFKVTWHSGKVSSVFETTLLSWHLWH